MTVSDFRRNAILARLPEREYQALKPAMQLQQAELHYPAYEPGQPIADVYFPLSAVFSIVAVAGGRARLEVATVGHEGMVGLPVYLGAASSPQSAFCQIAGDAIRVPVEQFRAALRHDGALHALLNRFTQATMVEMAQNVVCNRVHTTTARMARWLLTTHDRVERSEFTLTQEFLSQMLGVHRPTVSDTARGLQSQGLISYRRGQMTILDRNGLERSACECYRIVSDEFEDMRNQHPPPKR